MIVSRRPDYTKYNWCAHCALGFEKPAERCNDCRQKLRTGPRSARLKVRQRQIMRMTP